MKKYFFALIVLCSIKSNAQKQHLYLYPFGMEAYTFRNSFPVDPAKTLDTIKQMGITELECFGREMSTAKFRKLSDERGIRIISLGISYDELIEHPDSVVIKAKILGASYVMCAWIPHNGALTVEDCIQACKNFDRVGKILKEQGIVFCYHPHGYEFQPYGRGTLLDYFFQHTNPSCVSFEMDIFWIQFGGGDPIALLKRYGNRWKLMHLKDLRKGATTNPTGLTTADNDVPLGTGQIKIPGILIEARKMGISHYFIEDESNLQNEHVPQSISYLKNLLY